MTACKESLILWSREGARIIYYLTEGKMVQRCLVTCLRLLNKQEAVRNIFLNFGLQPPLPPVPPNKRCTRLLSSLLSRIPFSSLIWAWSGSTGNVAGARLPDQTSVAFSCLLSGGWSPSSSRPPGSFWKDKEKGQEDGFFSGCGCLLGQAG